MILLETPFDRIVEALAFEELEALDDPCGRIELWEPPNLRHHYALGADFSYGMRGRDYDTAIVLDINVFPWRQVAEAQGWWGEEFHRVLFALGFHYNYAWICGEAQLGLLQLRQLLKHGYQRIYYNRDERKRGRPVLDVLGHWARSDDQVVRKGRLAVREREVIVRSPALFSEIDRFAFVPKSRNRGGQAQDELRDKDLVPAASVGHDDLVRGLCYAVEMGELLPEFQEELAKYADGSLGQVLGHAEVFGDDEAAEPADPFGRHR